MTKYIVLFIFIFCNSYANAATSLTKDNITWTFADDYTTGTFSNGDPWVLNSGAGVVITGISPQSTITDGRTINGSMLNPSVVSNGYDSSLAQIAYSATLNVGRPGGNGLSPGNPLIITGQASLVSTRSASTAGARPQILDASVLTVVTSIPTAGAFRPPYAGTDKTIRYNISDIRWDLLGIIDQETITNLPVLSTLVTQISRLWLDNGGGTWVGRYIHPANNMPDYGRDMARITGDVSLAVLVNHDHAAIQPLLIHFLQKGIDWAELTAQNTTYTTSQGGYWMGGGGHGIGRKWPVIFAGIVLDDASLYKYCDGSSYKIFQEEQQLFYVSQADVDMDRYTADGRIRDPYTSDMIGLPEWGEQHYLAPARDGSNWDAPYRELVSASYCGQIMAAAMMGARHIWAWDPQFDYMYRWISHSISTSGVVAYNALADEVAREHYSVLTSYVEPPVGNTKSGKIGDGTARINSSGSAKITQ